MDQGIRVLVKRGGALKVAVWAQQWGWAVLRGPNTTFRPPPRISGAGRNRTQGCRELGCMTNELHKSPAVSVIHRQLASALWLAVNQQRWYAMGSLS